MSPVVWVVLGIVVVVLVAAIWLYNRLVRLRARADDGWATIDVQLRRRYDLIPNLVETVQGYATHERELFERVTEARTKAIEAGGVREQASAEHEVSTGLGISWPCRRSSSAPSRRSRTPGSSTTTRCGS